MGQEITVPDWAKQAPAQAFAALNPHDDNLAEGIGQSYPVIGYRGKVWSLRTRGEKHNFVRPDDGTPASYIDAIILGQAKGKSKSYYETYDPNVSGERPICASIDGVVPDLDVTQKQSDTCGLCPRNVWKTDANGRKGRECADYKRLAVLLLPAQTKALLGSPLMEPCFLRVPAASLNSLAVMGDTMTGQGFHYSSYITRISFEPNEAHPKMVFRPLQGLTDQEAPVILKLRGDPTVGRITGGEIALSRPAGTTVLSQAAAASGLVLENPPQQPSTAAVLPNTPQPPTPPTTSPSTNRASVPPATLPDGPTLATPVTEPGLVDIGYGLVETAATPPINSPPVSTVSGDAGAPEASDADLDVRLAKLINTQ